MKPAGLALDQAVRTGSLRRPAATETDHRINEQKPGGLELYLRYGELHRSGADVGLILLGK
jgi:hypothetical protein